MADSSDTLAIVLGLFFGLACPLVIVLGAIALMVLAPLLMRRKIASWHEGLTPTEAWNRIAVGASSFPFQFLPCTYLHEHEFQSGLDPATASERIAKNFTRRLGRQVLLQAPDGLILSIRYLPFLATDLGWIVVVLLEPDEHGTRIRMRFRTTSMMPVMMGIMPPLYLRPQIRTMLD